MEPEKAAETGKKENKKEAEQPQDLLGTHHQETHGD
jgi:hypothetical protein